MGQIIIWVGVTCLAVGVILFVFDALTYKTRQKKMIEKIENEFR